MTDNREVLIQERFRLDMGRKLFIMKIAEQWNKGPERLWDLIPDRTGQSPEQPGLISWVNVLQAEGWT